MSKASIKAGRIMLEAFVPRGGCGKGCDEVFHMDGHHRLKEWLLDYGKGGAGSGDQASIYTYDSIDNLEKVSVSGSAIAKYEELFTHGSSGKPHALYNRAKSADPQTF